MLKKYFTILFVMFAMPLMAAESKVVEKKVEPLPEVCMGSSDAPVTIIQYTSFTCTHCGEFHKTVLPIIEEQYVKTGKVRLIMRDYPSDKVSLEAAKIAWCCGLLRYKEIAGKLFDMQDEWLMKPDPSKALVEVAQKIGMTKEQIDKALKDKDLAVKLVMIRQDGKKKYNIDATPTIIINTIVIPYALTIEEFKEKVDPLIKAASAQ